MKVLVTGAAGFIGSHVSEKLVKEGHKVTGIDNFDPFYDRKIKENNLTILRKTKNFQFIEADIRDEKGFSSIGKTDLIIHLAAKAGVRPSIQNPKEYIATNIEGTQNLIDHILKNGISKIIFASSSSVYGNNTIPPFRENAVTDQPISPYAFTKKSCELMLYNYHTLYQIDCICLRFFTVYGPRQRPDLAINKFVSLINDSKPIELYGDGTSARDYTFITDITNGIVNAVNYLRKEKNIFEIINLGNNKPVTLLELVQTIETVLSKKAAYDWKKKQPGDVDITCADITKAGQLLNYHPLVSLEEGIADFCRWKGIN